MSFLINAVLIVIINDKQAIIKDFYCSLRIIISIDIDSNRRQDCLKFSVDFKDLLKTIIQIVKT
jgi:hypothetical protein